MSREQSKEKYKFPSVFGSHKSMINEKATAELDPEVAETCIVLTDEFGDYLTSRDRLDNGLADPSRCISSRLGKLLSGSLSEKS